MTCVTNGSERIREAGKDGFPLSNDSYAGKALPQPVHNDLAEWVKLAGI
jgi:hypothetical protein